ncbi:MAG: hypothetical protein IPK10_08020 [Bacteroidetes bacterium]|nr:hypothetical protein [Bacteroidota bacterium]
MLRKGARFYVAIELTKPGEFKFAGYTHVQTELWIDENDRSVDKNSLSAIKIDNVSKVYGTTLNFPATLGEKESYKRSQERIIQETWEKDRRNTIANLCSLIGSKRLIKVTDCLGDEDTKSYKNGLGIPQWIITKAINVREIAFAREYPNGRFIPDQGYKPILYK